MDRTDIKTALLEIARKRFKQGQGWSMDTVVLQEFVENYPKMKGDLKRERSVIECWHELFSEGTLVPGWDLDSPGYPWFHVADRG